MSGAVRALTILFLIALVGAVSLRGARASDACATILPNEAASPTMPDDAKHIPCEDLRLALVAICAHDYMDIVDGQLTNDRPNDQIATLQSTFSCWRALYDENERQHRGQFTLAIYFHGGLVDRPSGLASAVSLYPVLAQAGATPYFFIYNVGAAESVQKGNRERGLFWSADRLHDNADDALLARIGRSTALTSDRKDTGRDHGLMTPREDWMRDGLPPMSMVGRDGALAWAYMKQTILDGLDMTDDLYLPGHDPNPEPESCTKPNAIDADRWPHIVRGTYDWHRAGALLFLCSLGAFINGTDGSPGTTRRPAHRNVNIVLIGHSTGSIYITQLIRKVNRLWTDGCLSQQKVSVIFLAPAVSYHDFDRMLMEAGGRIKNLRIYTMDDWHERHDVLLGLLGSFVPPLQLLARYYDRSLLYAVSGLFEAQPDTPILGVARFLPPFSQSSAVLHYPKDALTEINRVDCALEGSFGPLDRTFVLSPSPPEAKPPYTTAAVDHGEFPTDGPTRNSVAALVNDIHLGIPWPEQPARDAAEVALYDRLNGTPAAPPPLPGPNPECKLPQS